MSSGTDDRAGEAAARRRYVKERWEALGLPDSLADSIIAALTTVECLCITDRRTDPPRVISLWHDSIELIPSEVAEELLGDDGPIPEDDISVIRIQMVGGTDGQLLSFSAAAMEPKDDTDMESILAEAERLLADYGEKK